MIDRLTHRNLTKFWNTIPKKFNGKEYLKCFDKINTPAFSQFAWEQDSAANGEGDAAEDGGGVVGVTGV